MKTRNLFLLPALIASVGLILAGRVTAQTFTTLHSFTGGDGAGPEVRLILSGNTLYGTTRGGTVFAINTDGTGFTTLYRFTAGASGGIVTNDLTLSGNTLYGTASSGGSAGSGRGTVFSVNTDGTGFTILHSFTEAPLDTNSDGALPYAGLVLSGNTLYGTARNGGSSDQGTVFAVNTDGTDFTTLHSFTATSGSNPFGNGTNSDGAQPFAALIFSGNTLYGTATGGGSSGSGTVFGVNTDGKGFT